MRLLTYTILAGLFLSGCKTKEPVTETVEENIETSVDDMFSTLDDNPTVHYRSNYNPSETRTTDLIHTHLSVLFDWQNHYLNGVATLELKPYFYPQNFLVLDAKGMDIHRVALVDNKAFKDLKYDYDGMILTVYLDRLYKRDESYKIMIDYTAKPDEYEMGGSSAISGDKGLYFINTDSSELNKPTQIWTQGETEASSRWFPTIDAPNEKMTQEIEITVPKQYKTLSNGMLVYSTVNKDGSRTDVWKQMKPHTPYLVMMAIGDFAVVTDHWKKSDGTKMEVSYYVEKEYEQYARDIFGETPNMIEFFSRRLGVEYVWDKYAQVVVRDYVSGAMENTSATIHGEFLHRTDRELLDEHNESIIAHELFHQWFGDLVTCESWSNLPLNESFANYSQYLWDEYRHGRDEADYNAMIEESNYKLSVDNGTHKQMIRYNYENKEDMFDAHSYNKGGRILHMLRKYVGDEAFFASLQKYLTDNQFKAAEIHHLRLAFEEVTGEDLNWFFDQWFLDKGHPTLVFEYEFDSLSNSLLLITRQTQDMSSFPVYKLKIPVDVYGQEEKERYEIWINSSSDTTILEYTQPPALVNFDAERFLLADITYEKSDDEYIYQFYNAPLYEDRFEALMACRHMKSEKAAQVFVDALSDPFWKIRETALSHMKKAVAIKNDAIRSKTIMLAEKDSNSLVRANALQAAEKYFNDSGEQELLFEKSLKDRSYLVVSVALHALADINLTKACEYAKFLESEKSSALKTTIGGIYAKRGKASDNDFFVDNWALVNGFEKISFMKTYGRFLEKQDDKLVFEGLQIFEEVAKNGGVMWIKYFGGYQILLEFRNHYREEMDEQKKQLSRLEKEGSSGADIALTQRELKRYQDNFERVDKMINDLIAQEKNQQVIDFVEAGASMEFIHEEE